MKREELITEITKLVNDNYFNEFKLCCECEDGFDDKIIKSSIYISTSSYIIDDIGELEDIVGRIKIEEIILPLPNVDKKDMYLDFISWNLVDDMIYIAYQLSTISDN